VKTQATIRNFTRKKQRHQRQTKKGKDVMDIYSTLLP
jgi:hypothetical protein